MAIKKTAPVQDLITDEAVSAALEDEKHPIHSETSELRKVHEMTPGKAKKKARDKARTKVTFDWPEWLIERLEEIAGVEGETFPLNQLAAVLTIEGLRAVEQGEIGDITKVV